MTKTFEALATGETLEMRIYGVIGSRWDDGVTAASVAQALKENASAKKILIRMSSPGGSAFDGMAIRSMLSSHPAKVTCEVEGLAASAASIIAMGADTIRMHEGSALMVHEASTFTEGDAQEHKRAIDALTTLNDGMAAIYAARSGMDKAECLALMAAETWLTPAQAVEKKLANEVIAGKQPSAATAMAFDFSKFGYRHVPEQFTAVAKSAPPTETKDIMSLAQIATALGLDSSSDAAAVLGTVGKLQSRANSADQTLTELRALTGAADGNALLGAVRGLAETAKQVPVLQAQIAEQKTELEAQEKAQLEQKRVAVFAADAANPAGRKLTPAMVAFYNEKDESGEYKRSVEELEAFLAIAATVVVTAATKPKPQPLVKGSSTPAAVSGSETLTHEGKSWEQMEPGEKQNLYAEQREVYDALQANWRERGSPILSPKARSQRASA